MGQLKPGQKVVVDDESTGNRYEARFVEYTFKGCWVKTDEAEHLVNDSSNVQPFEDVPADQMRKKTMAERANDIKVSASLAVENLVDWERFGKTSSINKIGPNLRERDQKQLKGYEDWEIVEEYENRMLLKEGVERIIYDAEREWIRRFSPVEEGDAIRYREAFTDEEYKDGKIKRLKMKGRTIVAEVQPLRKDLKLKRQHSFGMYVTGESGWEWYRTGGRP